MNEEETTAPASVATVGYHVHNGVDSPLLPQRDGVITFCLPGILPQTDTNYENFFSAPYPIRVNEIALYCGAVASSGADTLRIAKGAYVSGAYQDPSAGVSLLKSNWHLNGSDVPITGVWTRNVALPTLTSIQADLLFATNDVIGWTTSGSLAGLKNLFIRITYSVV